MSSECSRIADQLRRAFNGDAWHGPSLREALAGITAEQANARPIPGAHSIWELLLHIEAWVRAPLTAMSGTPMPGLDKTDHIDAEIDWPPVKATGSKDWESAKKHAFQAADEMVGAIEKFGDSRLSEIVPGRKYDFYFLLHGVVQHTLYHTGQIALLKKSVAGKQ
jgi:uncharacterized damage-inducible protein DinB